MIKIFLINILLFSSKCLLNNQFNLTAEFDLETIRKNILEGHNAHRKDHQVGDLVRNPEIEKIAQDYSQFLLQKGEMIHSNNTYKGYKLGENLFMKYSSSSISVTGKEADLAWYNEIKDYDFNKPGFSSKTGHFTQLVWKGSKEIGCGAACSRNKCFITCNYYPPGNYLNQFQNNVFPKKSDSSSSNFSEQLGKSNLRYFASLFLFFSLII